MMIVTLSVLSVELLRGHGGCSVLWREIKENLDKPCIINTVRDIGYAAWRGLPQCRQRTFMRSSSLVE